MTERWIAYILIGVGAVALASNVAADTGWLWVALVAAIFIALYLSKRQYGFLVLGCLLGGAALGLLFASLFAFLICVGLAFLAIDRIEPRVQRWPIHLSLTFLGLGVIVWLLEAGILGSVWFALALIAAGAYLLYRSRGGAWVEADPPVSDPQGGQGRERPHDASAVEGQSDNRITPSATGTPPPSAKTVAGATEPVAGATEPLSGATVEARPGPEPVQADSPPESDNGLVRARVESLRSWTKETSREQNVAPFVVLNEATIHAIAKRNPKDLQELSLIKGIGPAKLDRYGETILEVLRRHQNAR